MAGPARSARARASAGVPRAVGMGGSPPSARRARRAAACVIAAAAFMLPASPPSAAAAIAEPPVWRPVSLAEPTHLPPGGEGLLVVSATNVGGKTDGSAVTIEDTLPAGLSATAVAGYDAYLSGGTSGEGVGERPMTCSPSPETESPLRCEIEGVEMITGDSLVVAIHVKVGAPPGSAEPNEVTVSGGGAATAAVSNPVVVSPTPAGFGVAPGSLIAATSNDQAGAHASVTTAFTMNTDVFGHVAEDEKDIRFDLPPGLVGAAVGLPKCTEAKILEQLSNPTACPRDSMVGMVTLSINLVPGTAPLGFATPLYAIPPAPGEPAAFSFDALLLPVRLDTSVLSGGGYGVRITAPSLSEAAETFSTWITVWGVPADHSGPPASEATGGKTVFGEPFGGPEPAARRIPLMTNPQRCGVPMEAAVSLDSWPHPGLFTGQAAAIGPFGGCEALSLEPSFTMLPSNLEAGAPAGYTLDLNLPQNSEPDGLAAPTVKDLTLALPVGTVISPSFAWGLGACPEAQFGPHSSEPADCPRESRIGEVELRTPDLPEPLRGEVYLGSPLCGPCTPADAEDGRMVRLFVQAVAQGGSGIVVKLSGAGSIDQKTGRITTTFAEDPPLPFGELRLTLAGGPRAALANPRECGPAATNIDITPWSSPFTEDLAPSFAFDVERGCLAPRAAPGLASGLAPGAAPRFAPTLTAQTTNVQAGAYTPFTLAFGRGDEDGFFSGFAERLPPGLTARIAGAALCPEPGAGKGECPAGSLIGEVQALTGPGADPFLVGGGKVFLTGPYGGAPFGLSIVLPAVAGPYTLAGTTGSGTVVVRAAVAVDPSDAHLTITAGPLPTELDGIPLQIKVVDVTIDRGEFIINPTSCERTTIDSALTSVEGAAAALTTPFQVAGCAGLRFAPRLSASITGHASRADGVGLDVKLTYPFAAGQANVKSVRVELPKRLPSRLKTLQQACPDTVFAEDPSRCPPASRVGEARASTPILPDELTGPAWFVSHGGAAYPDLVVVLRDAEGVKVDLVGSTAISKSGITSTTFAGVPDVPIGAFELDLPEGPHSALAAVGRLCGRTLAMPTLFTAWNGAVLKKKTPIAVSGCPKAAHKRTRKHRTGRRPAKPRA
jgi:hypothetical protein